MEKFYSLFLKFIVISSHILVIFLKATFKNSSLELKVLSSYFTINYFVFVP